MQTSLKSLVSGVRVSPRWLAALAIALPAVVGSAAIAQAEAVKFDLTNESGLVIDQFYASPPSDRNWGNDILGRDVLYDGETYNITIDDGESSCLYDFQVVFQGRREPVVYEAVNICPTGRGNKRHWAIPAPR